MSPDTWVMLPTALIKSELVLKRFAVGDLGRSVAALKLYLVIAGHVANPRWGTDDEDYLGISYTQLCDWAAISRSMVGPALGKLQDLIDAVQGEFKENEDLPNTTNPDDWSRISGTKGERIINIRTLVSSRTPKMQSIEDITPGQYL